MEQTIAENIAHIRTVIADACTRAGRSPDSVTLVAVSKTHPASAILEAIAAGVQHFGENRVEESVEKIADVIRQVEKPPMWHMIGHVQSRKSKEVVPLFDMVHSVDSLKLAGKLSRLAQEQGKTLNVLLQVNVSGETSKEGIDAANWESDAAVRGNVWREVEQIAALPGLNVQGLMTIAPIADEMEDVRPVFANLRRLRDALSKSLLMPLPELSMGMTDDYPVAIEEGATLVRIGRAIFGERDYP